ncbi:MAG: hypothetical protein IT305_15035 [Chloroflexi bacterium]|nr:hypothetical protein [Chloroflexota bacterium]
MPDVNEHARPASSGAGRAATGTGAGGRERTLARTAQFALLVLTLAACWVRAVGLPTVQGTMGRDEARLALAARGILEHGLPILPDGLLYTRGLLPAYAEAAAFAVGGFSDQIARLPAIVAGTLLVPAVFWLTRLRGGNAPALAAAAIVAFAQPLVLQSREAWLYSWLLLWLVLAIGWLVRDAPGDRLRAGFAALAALFSHELAVLLVPVAALLELARIAHRYRPASRPSLTTMRGGVGRGGQPHHAFPRDGTQQNESSQWNQRWRRRIAVPPDALLFWGMLLLGVATVGGLSLALRAPTAAGSTAEVREYLRPGFDLAGLAATLTILGGWHAWLLPAAALAIPLTRTDARRLLAGRRAGPLLLMTLAIIAFNGFGLVRRGESRYVLPALPFLAAVASLALWRVGPRIAAVLAGSSVASRSRAGQPAARSIVAGALLVLLVLGGIDPGRLIADAQIRMVANTWVQAVADRRPNDLIVSFAPTLTTHYLGRTDVWLRAEGYEKYTWADETPPRDVHSGAIVVRDLDDLNQLLVQPNRGRIAWVILAGEPDRESSPRTRAVARALLARASEVRRPTDGRVILKVRL